MRVLIFICFFFACAAYASPVNFPGHSPQRTTPPLGATPKSSTGGTTSCSRRITIQWIWESRGAYIGPTGSGTKGELYHVNGEAGIIQGHAIVIKKITKFSIGTTVYHDKNTVKEAVRREAYHLELLGMLAINGYGVDQNCYYIVMWKGVTASQTGLSKEVLDTLKEHTRSSVESKAQLLIDVSMDRNFLFYLRDGGDAAAFPVELSDARDKHGVMRAVPNNVNIRVERFRQLRMCTISEEDEPGDEVPST